METQAEKRSNINYELIQITEEMKIEMEKARQKQYQVSNQFDTTKPIDENHNNFRDYDQDQSFFLVVTKDKFLENSHPAVIIDTIIEKLDLSILYQHYSKEGNPAFHPKMMLKILFYAYYVGVLSCRTIWDAVVNRSDFIFLAAGQVPNFRTINDFRLRHLDDLANLFAQIVFMCKELDMLDFKHMAVDGQKIQANASFRNSKNLSGIKKEYKKIKTGVEKLLNKEVNEDFTAEKKEKRISTLEKKLKKLEEFQKILKKADDDDKRINMVDPDAPVMAHKDGQKLPSYTHQTARDGKCGVVTAVETTQNNDKAEDLLPLVDQSIANTGEKHENVTADCGFCDYDLLQKVETERDENFHVPDRRFAASQKEGEGKFGIDRFTMNDNDDYICPAGKPLQFIRTNHFDDGHSTDVYHGVDCSNCPLKDKCTKGEKRIINIDSRTPYRDKMREKLKSDKGREIYMQRQYLIESVHGDDQKNRKWIQHHLRSYVKAKAEFILMRIATNLALIIKHRSKEVLAWV